MALTVLDAGVLIGVLDRADPHHGAAVRELRGLLEAGEDLVAPATVCAEVLVGPLRRGGDAVEVVESFLRDTGIHVEPTSRQIARLAAVLRARHASGFRLPDAVVVATAQALDADRVVTTDARWPAGLPVAVKLL